MGTQLDEKGVRKVAFSCSDCSNSCIFFCTLDLRLSFRKAGNIRKSLYLFELCCFILFRNSFEPSHRLRR